jgi:hypothetical protein
MERSPNLSLCVAAEKVEPTISCGVNIFADQVAAAMKRSASPNTGSEREPHPIETAPKDGRFLILKEDASGKFNIARWASEAGGWVRENDQPIKITPAYWYPIPERNDFQPRLDASTNPSEPERPAAPQLQLVSGVLASRSNAASPDATSPDTIMAAKMDATAVEPKSATARNRFAALSIVASLVVAIGVGMYFRAELTGDLLRIRSGQVEGQVTQWMSRHLENHVSPGHMSHSQHAPQADASEPQISVLQRRAEVGGVASGTTLSESDTLLEPAANGVEHSPSLAAERNRAVTLASELAMTRRDIEAKAALLSRATGEAEQTKQAAEATAAELHQSLVQERDRVAALVRELAKARRDLETEVALSRKAGEEAEQLKQSAKAATGEQKQERNASSTLAPDESAQRMMGAPSTMQRPASNPIVDNAVAKRLRQSYRTTPVKDSPDLARLMARASELLAQGNIGAARAVRERAADRGNARAYDGGLRAAQDRSRALEVGEGPRRPAGWFGREGSSLD